MDMKLELVPMPVADVDRAKAFYRRPAGIRPRRRRASPRKGCGWFSSLRPARPAPFVIGTGLGEISDMTPGTIKGLHLVVNDIARARDELIGRGVDVGDIVEVGGGVAVRLVHRPGREQPDPAADGLANRRQLLIGSCTSRARPWLGLSALGEMGADVPQRAVLEPDVVHGAFDAGKSTERAPERPRNQVLDELPLPVVFSPEAPSGHLP